MIDIDGTGGEGRKLIDRGIGERRRGRESDQSIEQETPERGPGFIQAKENDAELEYLRPKQRATSLE